MYVPKVLGVNTSLGTNCWRGSLSKVTQWKENKQNFKGKAKHKPRNLRSTQRKRIPSTKKETPAQMPAKLCLQGQQVRTVKPIYHMTIPMGCVFNPKIAWTGAGNNAFTLKNGTFLSPFFSFNVLFKRSFFLFFQFLWLSNLFFAGFLPFFSSSWVLHIVWAPFKFLWGQNLGLCKGLQWRVAQGPVFGVTAKCVW